MVGVVDEGDFMNEERQEKKEIKNQGEKELFSVWVTIFAKVVK